MEKERPNRTAFISVLSIATFVMALSMLALAPTTASLMSIWHVSFAQVEWLTTVFLLVMCISMLISPWLLQNIGFRKLILMLLGCFVAGTLLLVLTPWYFLALIGRILEAIALGITLSISPARHHNRGQAKTGDGDCRGSNELCNCRWASNCRAGLDDG